MSVLSFSFTSLSNPSLYIDHPTKVKHAPKDIVMLIIEAKIIRIFKQSKYSDLMKLLEQVCSVNELTCFSYTAHQLQTMHWLSAPANSIWKLPSASQTYFHYVWLSIAKRATYRLLPMRCVHVSY